MSGHHSDRHWVVLTQCASVPHLHTTAMATSAPLSSASRCCILNSLWITDGTKLCTVPQLQGPLQLCSVQHQGAAYSTVYRLHIKPITDSTKLCIQATHLRSLKIQFNPSDFTSMTVPNFAFRHSPEVSKKPSLTH